MLHLQVVSCSDSDNWKVETHSVSTTPFVQPVGPAHILPPSLLEIFKLFMTSALVAMIVEQSNLYARQVLGDAADTWEDITENDIWAMFGFCILMGINKLPALHQYWSHNPVYHYRPVAERITRDRFFAIMRFLHFVDNTTLVSCTDPEYD